MTFRDHFSKQAASYARHRPGYPAELFDYLAGLAPAHNLAWDCGTGNGQAAVNLAERFARVVATDASSEQLANAFPHERVEYRNERSERTSLEASTVDLVTVATAVHWFDLDPFYAEVQRVTRPGGALAVWAYHLPRIAPGVDEWLAHYFRHTVRPYWPDRFYHIDEGYRNLYFPFAEIDPPDFHMETTWDLDCLIGFLFSWSLTQRFIEAKGSEPFEEQMTELSEIWGDKDARRQAIWPLHFRIGRVS
ncbi:MAG: class I SAM-dependent methyltransferase [Caldilineales bacterium]|nr:class I SAM-dependent methyltransferase [Caldilineales bacterium]